MIGIFDSGVGGICAYHKLRELLPREDILYLGDRKNAPYGTKPKDEQAGGNANMNAALDLFS